MTTQHRSNGELYMRPQRERYNAALHALEKQGREPGEDYDWCVREEQARWCLAGGSEAEFKLAVEAIPDVASVALAELKAGKRADTRI